MRPTFFLIIGILFLEGLYWSALARAGESARKDASLDLPMTLEQERALRPMETFRECHDCPELVVGPSGSFTMGSADGMPFKFMVGLLGSDQKAEFPALHRVTIKQTFAAGRMPVTFAEWDACVADGGCASYRPFDQGWGRGLRPVINVSWNDAVSYASWLSRKTGKSYRLLSEAEFEYVVKAGSETAYPWGTEIGAEQENCDGCGSLWDKSKVSQSLGANSFGVYKPAENPCGRDSSLRAPPCNVWEWVEDCDHGNRAGHGNYVGAPTDGSAWTERTCRRHVVRGGVWYYYPQFLRSAYRSAFNDVYRNYFLGFRIARSLVR
jgi:formylglycine-generating enzyme required for sulfatase activity